jgi:DNA-binding FadR family transcriptional regulator
MTQTESPLRRESPIRRARLHELVARKIEQMIQSGELKPGERLPSERDLMSTFRIGRPAVREAFLSLQNKGLILTESGRRATVAVPDVHQVFTTLDSVVGIIIRQSDSLKNLFDARTFIEAAMARSAAGDIDACRLAELKETLEANHQAIGDRERFMETDIAFHRILFRVPNNPVFEAVHGALVGWLMERWRTIKRNRATETLAYQGHFQVYRAIARRDPNGAEKAMRRHLSSSWTIWDQQLER